ncbi:hypothetical protein D3C84_802100 [compost metagenome]
MLHILGHVTVNDETYRHLDPLTGLQHLLGKAETFGLVEVRRRIAGRDARHGLGAHRFIGGVVGDEDHLVHRPRVRGQFVMFGIKVPRHVGGVGRQKLHAYLPRGVDRLLTLVLPAGLAINAEGLAHHVVDRHQGKAEHKHCHHHGQQARDQFLHRNRVSHDFRTTLQERACSRKTWERRGVSGFQRHR